MYFDSLSNEAQVDFKDYYRNGQLIITAKAVFDKDFQRADVRQYGNRLGFEAFAPFFKAVSDGASVPELRAIYGDLREFYKDLDKATTKDAMAQALRAYETARPHECILIRSEDQFYGFSKGGNRLSKYVQWVYVPAVKDAASEQIEAKDTALGKLLARTVRTRANFAESVKALRAAVCTQYQALLDQNQHVLDDLTSSLGARLSAWAHPDTRLQLQWRQDPDRSVRLDEPAAHVLAGEGDFLGELARLGHGLQRSYLIALLQELAAAGSADGPRLILGCEEPELYQHPPQARHLADVLRSLSTGNSQVLITTHSPYFVSGESFEDIRVVRRDRATSRSSVQHTNFDEVAVLVAHASEKKAMKRNGLMAKIHQSLQVGLSEMFFTPRLILVEGLEDVAYLNAYLHLTGLWDDARRQGCHIVAANKKSELLQPLAIATRLKIPTLVVCDSDAVTLDKIPDPERRERETNVHRRDNLALLRLCGYSDADPLPKNNFWSDELVMWASNLGDTVAGEIGPVWSECREQATKHYDHAGDLKKNALHIAASLTDAWDKGHRSTSLERLIRMFVLKPDVEFTGESGMKTA